MTSPTYEPDTLSALLGDTDIDVRLQAVELFRTLRSPEDCARAALIAAGLDEVEPMRAVLERLWPGVHNAPRRTQMLRGFAVDCAVHTLPALAVYQQRPWHGFAGRMPDLSLVGDALQAARVADRAAMVSLHDRLQVPVSACRRWSRAAATRGGPERLLRRALEALRAVRHTCILDPLDAAHHACWSAQRAAASPLAEIDWQRGWFVERLLGAAPLPLPPLLRQPASSVPS